MTRRRWTLAMIVALSSPAAASAQDSAPLTSFLQDLSESGRRFEDVRVAVAEGYRKLGPDFPGMGEHWVHPGLVIAGELDPAHPPVIGYTMVHGERRLVSFAYTRVLGPDESPPDAPFPHPAWHDHTGGVDEESLLLSGPMSMDEGGGGFRLSMVHVWLGVENPDGVLAQNNWMLPFLRAGVASPHHASSEAARALSLATRDGMAFYDQLLREGVRLEAGQLDLAMSAFDEAGDSAEEWSAGRDPDPAALEEIWSALWARLDRTMSDASLQTMAPLRGSHGGDLH